MEAELLRETSLFICGILNINLCKTRLTETAVIIVIHSQYRANDGRDTAGDRTALNHSVRAFTVVWMTHTHTVARLQPL